MNIPNANRYRTQQGRAARRQQPPMGDNSGELWGWVAAGCGVATAVGVGALVIAHPVMAMVGIGTLAYLAFNN